MWRGELMGETAVFNNQLETENWEWLTGLAGEWQAECASRSGDLPQRGRWLGRAAGWW